MRRREFGEAHSHLERALALNPNDTQPPANAAEAFCYLDHVEKAIERG